MPDDAGSSITCVGICYIQCRSDFNCPSCSGNCFYPTHNPTTTNPTSMPTATNPTSDPTLLSSSNTFNPSAAPTDAPFKSLIANEDQVVPIGNEGQVVLIETTSDSGNTSPDTEQPISWILAAIIIASLIFV